MILGETSPGKPEINYAACGTQELVSNRWFSFWTLVLVILFLGLNITAGGMYRVFDAKTYLVMHMIFEFASIVAALCVSLMGWYNFSHLRSLRLLLISVTFCMVGIVDFAHTLSYVGMPDFLGVNTANKASTLWIAARLIQAAGLLAAVLAGERTGKKMPFKSVPFVAVALSFILVAAIIYNLDSLIPMYDQAAGMQTPLKIYLEYLVILVFLATSLVIFCKRGKQKGDIYLVGSFLAGIMSELDFTFYSHAYDVYNLLGHGFKIISFAFILKAVVEEAMNSIFRANLELAARSEELAGAIRHLKEADKLKNDFLANTNHELRSPLSSIVAFTELVLDEKSTGALNELQRDYVREVNDSARELLFKIKGLLDLSGVLAGKTVLSHERIPLNSLVEEVMQSCMHTAWQKGITLNALLPEKENIILADRGKVQCILVNLLDNAVKFTGRDGVIRVEVAVDERQACISVADSGIGLEKKQVESIFKAFYQVDGTSTRTQGGTGIGLTLANKLAELHGGRISVESEYGRGSRFTVILPLS